MSSRLNAMSGYQVPTSHHPWNNFKLVTKKYHVIGVFKKYCQKIKFKFVKHFSSFFFYT